MAQDTGNRLFEKLLFPFVKIGKAFELFGSLLCLREQIHIGGKVRYL